MTTDHPRSPEITDSTPWMEQAAFDASARVDGGRWRHVWRPRPAVHAFSPLLSGGAHTLRYLCTIADAPRQPCGVRRQGGRGGGEGRHGQRCVSLSAVHQHAGRPGAGGGGGRMPCVRDVEVIRHYPRLSEIIRMPCVCDVALRVRRKESSAPQLDSSVDGAH